MGKAIGVGVFGLLLAGIFAAYGLTHLPMHGEDLLVVVGGCALFGLIGVVCLIVGIVKAVGAAPAGAEQRAQTPRRRDARHADELDLVEEEATRITVRTAEGGTKTYKLASSRPADLQKAIARLKAKGCKVVNIESAQ